MLRHEKSVQVLLRTWVKTLAMLAAVVAVVVLVWHRRTERAAGSSRDESRVERGLEAVPREETSG